MDNRSTPGDLDRRAEAEDFVRRLSDPGTEQLARIYYWRGRNYWYRSDYKEAEGALQAVLPLVRESGNQVLKAEAAVFLGMTWGAQGKFGRAREILPPALPVLERAQALPEWLRGNGWPALAQSQSGECAAELAQAQRALARVLELRNPHEISLAHFYLASVFRFGGEVEQSIVEGQAAIAPAEPAVDNYLLYVGYVALAWAESQSGQHEAGRRSLEQAKRLMAGMGGRLGVADWEKPAY